MINKINSNISFKGKVYIGGTNEQQRTEFAKKINTYAPEDKERIIWGLSNIKSILKSATPEEDTYLIDFKHTKSDDFGDTLQLSVEKGKATLKTIEVSANDVNSEDEFTKTFSPESQTNAIRRIFTSMADAMHAYVREVNYKPKESDEIEQILSRLE